MSIQKKSLISTLKTAKKANVAKEDLSDHSRSSAVGSPSKKIGGLSAPSKKIGGLSAPSKKIGGLNAPSKKMSGVTPSIKF